MSIAEKIKNGAHCAYESFTEPDMMDPVFTGMLAMLIEVIVIGLFFIHFPDQMMSFTEGFPGHGSLESLYVLTILVIIWFVYSVRQSLRYRKMVAEWKSRCESMSD